MRQLLEPHAVSAILEHEVLIGISPLPIKKVAMDSMDTLLELLTLFKRTLNLSGADPHLVSMFFIQLFHYPCAIALNYLMQGKYHCHFSRGMTHAVQPDVPGAVGRLWESGPPIRRDVGTHQTSGTTPSSGEK
uniref:Unconventional myosin-Va n=1 Tax=Lygus hesperus TaxID=30085 RepID=A0A146LDN5_LYGHE